MPQPNPAIRRTKVAIRNVLLLFLLAFLLPLVAHGLWVLTPDNALRSRTADWSSAKLLPQASAAPEASVHVYSAPAARWRGIFAVHTWIVVKEKDADHYSRFDVTGWGRPIKTDRWAPDGRWFGSTPRLVAAIDGPAAERLIPKIRLAVARYPHSRLGDYRVWPGPNSNTFVAAIIAEIPGARIALPSNAIGKDFRGSGLYVGFSPTRTGIQVSVAGLFGLTIAWVEGLEINMLGLVTGIDFRQLAIKLPGWGPLTIMPWRNASAEEDGG